MAQYKICERCGAHLDFGEFCDCESEEFDSYYEEDEYEEDILVDDEYDAWDEVDRAFNEWRDEKVFREFYGKERG